MSTIIPIIMGAGFGSMVAYYVPGEANRGLAFAILSVCFAVLALQLVVTEAPTVDAEDEP